MGRGVFNRCGREKGGGAALYCWGWGVVLCGAKYYATLSVKQHNEIKYIPCNGLLKLIFAGH